jgi:hypothetical protein
MRSFVAPTRRGAITLLLTLWQISNTAARTFVVGALRDGAIDLDRFGRALRLIAASGLLLIFGFLFSILFNDLLRVNGPLELLSNDSTATRGLLVPRAAIAISLLAITLGWGYALAGALSTSPALRWTTLLAYGVFAILPLSSLLFSSGFGALEWIVLALLAMLFIDFLVLPRVALPFPLEWSLVLAPHAGLVLLALLAAARLQALGDEPWVSTLTSSLVQSHIFFIAPFLVIAGLGWADFGLEASGWAVKAVRRHATTALVVLLLLALLGYRLYGLLSSTVSEGVGLQQWGAWAGAALFGAGLLPIAIWRRRQSTGGDVPRRLLVTLAVLLPLAQILVAAVLQLAQAAILIQPFQPDMLAQTTRIRMFLAGLSELEPQYRPLLLAFVGLLIAWIAQRRRAASLAAYGLILAWSQALTWLTRARRPLAAFQYTYADIDAVGLVALTALALAWLLRGRLTGARALRLLGLALLMALLNQTGFLDNPFSPLFGFAGVIFLVFGIVWNILTAGGQFVNQSSPGLPRDSRLLLYVGYVLLSVSVAHWYLVSHNIVVQIVQGDINVLGFLVLGLPLAYLTLVEGGERLLGADSTIAA